MANRLLLCAGFLSLSLAAAGKGDPGQGGGIPPFFDGGKSQSAYNGPGREDPEPTGLTEVRIGYFGPNDPRDPEGGPLWLGVNLAIDEANTEGGYRGIPFRLRQAWAENPWSNGAGLVVKMVYLDKVWAIIGGIDGATTHLAETVVAKACVPLLSAAATDKTVNLANVPWMFSSLPGDQLLAPALGNALLQTIGDGTFGVVSSSGHDSHMFADELEKFLSSLGRSPVFSFVLPSGKISAEDYTRHVMEAQPAAVVVVANALDSAGIVNALRQGGFTGKVFGSPSMGRRSFRSGLRTAGNGIYYPCPSGEQEDDFGRTFWNRYGFNPDYTARYGYETARLLIAAIRRAGLNRARIRDAVHDLSPWHGSAAEIEWDGLGRNRRPGGPPPVCSNPSGK